MHVRPAYVIDAKLPSCYCVTLQRSYRTACRRTLRKGGNSIITNKKENFPREFWKSNFHFHWLFQRNKTTILNFLSQCLIPNSYIFLFAHVYPDRKESWPQLAVQGNSNVLLKPFAEPSVARAYAEIVLTVGLASIIL